MADLAQHSNYTARYSGLLDNLYVTAVIAGTCLIGYEIEVHIPRRRGQEGPIKRVPVRLILATKRVWRNWRRGESESKELKGEASQEGLILEMKEEDGTLSKARRRLGSREAWEFA